VRKLAAMVIALVVGSTMSASADLIIAAFGVPATEDFETYTGAGFDPNPAAGELDSDDWRTEGMSDGDTGFGDTATTGDHARGTSSGGETTGGFYAFDTGGNNEIFGWQPTGPDYTPGAAVLRLQNDTGTTITSLEISYDIYVFNNADRANSLNFAHSDDDITFTDEPSLDFTTPQTDDPSAVWESTPRNITLTGLNIPDGGNFYLQWNTEDVTGSGSRDEFGIDNVSVTAVPEPATTALFGIAALAACAAQRRRRT